MPAKSPGMVRAEWLVFGILLLFCITAALTQQVNPFPEDNWFRSQYLLFTQAHGADNYTPISAPAYFYFGIHILALLLQFDLQAEFYLASLIQSLIIFLAGLCLYRAHCLLGLRALGLLVTSAFVLFVESTLIPRAFWSETIVLFLMTVMVLCATRIACHQEGNDRTLQSWSLLLGVSVGLLVITRMVPIVLLPVFIWLFHGQLDRTRARLASTIVVLCVIVFVVGAMSANKWRFDRFELSNSMGRHLWQNVRHEADVMLADSDDYQRLKRAYPEIADKNWWEVPEPALGFEHLTREQLLRDISMQAITTHPLFYLRFGPVNTPQLLWHRPGQWGNWESGYNPLKRSGKLPPLLAPFPGLKTLLSKINHRSGSIWPLATFGILFIWLVSALNRLRIHLRKRSVRGSQQLDHGNTVYNDTNSIARMGDFLVFALIAQLWVTGQIEPALSRYILPYLSILALLGSVMLHTLTQALNGRNDHQTTDHTGRM